MSSENPYYCSLPENDAEFAQELSENKNKTKSASSQPQSDHHRKPLFSSVDQPSVPLKQIPQKKNSNIFTSLIDKYKNKRNVHDLSSPTYCENCKQVSQSLIVKKNSFIVWILCIFLLITTYVCFFLPFMFDALKNKHAICKNCGKTKFIINAF